MKQDTTVRLLDPRESQAWDGYVLGHDEGTVYHLSPWREIIEKAYGHKGFHLLAERPPPSPSRGRESGIVGILPLIHMRSLLFGSDLVSMPFVDQGGMLWDDLPAARALLARAVALGRELKARSLELRDAEELPFDNPPDDDGSQPRAETWSEKHSMILRLPPDSDALMKSFKSKLRSQIKRPVKAGLTGIVGHLDLLDDFYEVFAANMRDLGSPVHSKSLIRRVLQGFGDRARICMVYRGRAPLAGSVVLGFKDTVKNPWASSLKAYSRLSPNMLLYWTMLKHSCEEGYRFFDFGRSTPREGTYKFKEQWGAVPRPLHWHRIALDGKPDAKQHSEKSKFDKAIQVWMKLPLPVTRTVGPWIRKQIPL